LVKTLSSMLCWEIMRDGSHCGFSSFALQPVFDPGAVGPAAITADDQVQVGEDSSSWPPGAAGKAIVSVLPDPLRRSASMNGSHSHLDDAAVGVLALGLVKEEAVVGMRGARL
jgi:hypothetical protein